MLNRLNEIGIRWKLVGLFLILAVVLIMPMSIISLLGITRIDALAHDEINHLIDNDLDHVSALTYQLISAHDAAVRQKVAGDLNVALHIIEDEGGLQTCGGQVNWATTNQITRSRQTITLPRLCAGSKWLGQNSSMDVETPIVDEVRELIGGTSTIFQVMNESGDLLRVATNVPASETERAIGTYIPATNPDGTPNPVVATIQRGETYNGLAYVWDDWYITVYHPMYDESGQLFAVLYVGVRQEEFGTLYETLRDIRIGDSGYVFVIGTSGSDRGRYIIAGDPSRDGEMLWNSHNVEGRYVIREMVEQGEQLGPDESLMMDYLWKNPGDTEPAAVEARILYYEPWNWIIGFHARQSDYSQFFDQINRGRNELITLTAVVGLLFTGGAGVLVWITSSTLSRPLIRLANAAQRLAGGDLSQRVPEESSDELGRLAFSFNRMADKLEERMEKEKESQAQLQEMVKDLEAARARSDEIANEQQDARENLEIIVADYTQFVDRVANGDLTSRLELNGKHSGDLGRLGERLNAMVENLSRMTRQIREIAANVTSAATQIQSVATQQTASTNEQDVAVTQTSVTVEQVRTTVNQTAERAQSVASTSNESLNIARDGLDAVAITIDRMRDIQGRVASIAETILSLSERTQQIGAIIETVNDIAEQSKLLALNASIEAARAGEDGKGFAVVALEVRQLAEQSRDATSSIRDILNEIQQATNAAVMVTESGSKGTEAGVNQADLAAQSIRELANAIENAAQSSTQIAASTQQQINGIDQLSIAISQIKEATSQTASSARLLAQSVDALSSMAREMENSAARYQL